ncbi:MAG: hypothetical protein RLZZ15_3444 [Verrucomicrobiota bacterium]
MRLALRQRLLPLHLWAGLTTGLVLILIALTGAALIFRSTLERPLDTARFVVPAGATRLTADELVARARVANPAAELESVRFYGDPTAPVLVYFKDKRYVHLDPHTGAVLGLRARYGEGYGWIEGLHKYLGFAPSNLGENINGTFALIFAGLLATGVLLWWPATRRALVAGVTFNLRLTGRPWNLNLHKTVGIFAAFVLLACAATSLPIAFDSVRAALYPLTFSAKTPLPVPASPAAPFGGFNALTDRVAALMPGARETFIPLPKNGVVAAYAIAADAPHATARSYVWCDGATGRVLRSQPYAEAPAGFRLYYWMMAFHIGAIGGWPVKIVLLLATLAVPLLAWTGAASFLRRRATTAARRKTSVAGRAT